MPMSSTAVQLVFAGEVLTGFSHTQVREKLGRRLRLDEPRLNKLFSGQRVVIKRGLSPAEAADWVQRFRAIGAVLHAVPAKPASTHSAALPAPPLATPPPPAAAALPKATPPAPVSRSLPAQPDTSLMLSLVPDSELPPPPPSPPAPPRAAAAPRAAAPSAAAASTPEEITCPNCGERQSKRVICRACVCDMPRTLAVRQAEAEARRQARLEELRARNEQRLAQEQQSDEDAYEDEIPPLLSLSLQGRMGRVRFLGSNALGLACTLGLWVGLFASILLVPKAAVLWVGGLISLVLMAWCIRLTVLRLHDLNRSGWFALLQLVPGVNAVFSLWLLLWPGSAEENDYGTAVDDAQWLWAVFGVVVFGAVTVATTPQFLAVLMR